MAHDVNQRWTRTRLTTTPDYLPALPDHCSPYLLPQWALFWQRVWPRAEAEYWRAHDSERERFAVCVRRRRGLWNWVFCLPYGTPGMWGDEASAGLDRGLLTAMSDRRTVQVSFGGSDMTSAIEGWTRLALRFHTYVLDLRQTDAISPLVGVSDHHRRNIEKGRVVAPQIQPILSADDVRRMQSAWPGTGEGGSRLVLHRERGPALADVFAGCDNLHWLAAWQADRPVATCVWLRLGARAVYVDGAVNRNARGDGLNHYLFECVLLDLYERGVRHFDFGGGPLGETAQGLARFKEGWGAIPEERHETIYRRPLYGALHRIVR